MAEASTNMRLWDDLGVTDPKHTKPFKRSGGFSGTAIKPMWVWKRLTDKFGPCGEGWGFDKPTFQVVPGSNQEVLVYSTVEAWYAEGDKRHYVSGVGGDKIVTYIKANEQYKRPERWENDDEAFKKAFTDALMNAFKFVGVAADVHMGMFEDNKYTQEAAEHFEQEREEQERHKSAAELKRTNVWQDYEKAIDACETLDALAVVFREWWPKIKIWKGEWQQLAIDRKDDRKKALQDAVEAAEAEAAHLRAREAEFGMASTFDAEEVAAGMAAQ